MRRGVSISRGIRWGSGRVCATALVHRGWRSPLSTTSRPTDFAAYDLRDEDRENKVDLIIGRVGSIRVSGSKILACAQPVTWLSRVGLGRAFSGKRDNRFCLGKWTTKGVWVVWSTQNKTDIFLGLTVEGDGMDDSVKFGMEVEVSVK